MTEINLEEKAESPPSGFRFGPYEVDRTSGQVRKHGMRIRLSGQPLEVLYLLLERAGDTVTREELKQRLWPSDVFVHFETSLNTAVKKLRQSLNDSREAARYIETQSGRGYRFVAPVERILPKPLAPALEQAARLSTARPVSVAERPPEGRIGDSPTAGADLVPLNLERSSPGKRRPLNPHPPQPEPPLASSRNSSRAHLSGWLLASALVALALAAGTFFWSSRREIAHARGGSPPKPRMQSTIAVLGFKNLSATKSDGWLSVAFSEMISTELQQGGDMRTIPAETVAEVRRGLGLAEKDGYTVEVLRQTRDILGCDYVVAGSYISLAEKDSPVRLDIRVQESLSGETLASFSVTGRHSEIFDLVGRAGKQMRAKLAGSIAPNGDVDWRTVVPENDEAARAYSQGLQQARVFDAAHAAELFQRVVALAPNFALGHAALADAWAALGYNNRARAEASKAVSLMGSAPENVRLTIEARQYEITQDWRGAVAAYHHLLQDYPEDLDAGLKLAAAQANAKDPKAALATISLLRALPGSAGTDPRIDLTEAVIAKQQADSSRQLKLAVSGGQKAHERKLQLLFARAKLLEGSALDSQAKWDDATRAYEDARRIFQEAGNTDGAATAVNDIAIVMERRGNINAAKESLEAARREFEAVGDDGSLGAVLANLGENLRAQGQLPEAQKAYEDAISIFVKTGRTQAQLIVQSNLASIMVRRGRFREARKQFEGLLQQWKQNGDPSGVAHAQMYLADVMNVQGDTFAALDLAQNAATAFATLHDPSDAAQAQATMAAIYLQTAENAKARQVLQEALKTAHEIGAEGDAAVDSVLLAKTDLQEGNAAGAVRESQAALDVLKKEQRPPDELQARAVLANALLLTGHFDEASRVITEANAIHNADWLGKFEVARTVSQLSALTGKSNLARQQLQSAQNEARNVGCRLCLGELHDNKQLSARL